MSEASGNFETMIEAILRRIVKEELQVLTDGKKMELVSPEQLAEQLKIPASWVYEQSRQGNIPTHRIGRYIRFNLQEVIKSQTKKV